MKRLLPLLAVLLFGLTACQTIRPERTNNCTCAWEKINSWETTGATSEGVLA